MRRSELKEEPFPETYEQRIVRIEEYQKEIQKAHWNHVIDGMQTKNQVFKEIMRIIKDENQYYASTRKFL